MSVKFLVDCCEYLQQASVAAPSTLPDMAGELRRAQLRRLPVNVLYEPLACPVHDITEDHDLFGVPDENRFYLDLLGPDKAQDVLCAEELRQRLWGLLDRANARLWLISDAYTNACRSALWVERSPGTIYRLRALFLDQDALADGTQAETLLLAVVGLADRRGAELRVSPTQTPIVRLLYAAMGFMQEGDDLVRPPISELVRGEETLGVVLKQIDTHWSAHRDAHLVVSPTGSERKSKNNDEEDEEEEEEATADTDR